MKAAGTLLLVMLLLEAAGCTTPRSRTSPARPKEKMCEPADGVTRTRSRPDVKCRQ